METPAGHRVRTMSDRKRARETRDREDKDDHKRHKASRHDVDKHHVETQQRNQEVQKIKHVETL